MGRKKSKFRRFIGGLFIFLSVAFTIYLTVIMVNRINLVTLKDAYINVFKYELAICAAFILLAFDIRFGFFTAMRSKVLKFFGWILRLVIVLAVGLVIFLSAKIVIGGTINTPGTSQNAIVLGLALQNGKPMPDLIDRVDTAAEFSREYPNAKLILTGGNANGGLTEAEVMRDLLIERGVDPGRMILEDKATNTIDNFRNTAEIIDPVWPVVLITSDYHMYRSVITAENAGFTYVIRRPAPSSRLEYPVNIMWEVVHELNRLKSGR